MFGFVEVHDTIKHFEYLLFYVPLQSHWVGVVSQSTASATSSVTSDTHSSTVVPPATINTQVVAPLKCNWTEHTSPDGYKYYYNSVTGESKVRIS